MFQLFTKRKISEEQLTQNFVSGLLNLVDQGFPAVADLINNDPDFAVSPKIQAQHFDQFLLIVFAGNLQMLPDHFESYQDMRIADSIYRKLAEELGVDLDALKKSVGKYQNFCSRMNHPSKNILRGMAMGVFYKYKLNDYQQDFFKSKDAPNPVFLKRTIEILENFIWDWSEYKEKYRISE